MRKKRKPSRQPPIHERRRGGPRSCVVLCYGIGSVSSPNYSLMDFILGQEKSVVWIVEPVTEQTVSQAQAPRSARVGASLRDRNTVNIPLCALLSVGVRSTRGDAHSGGRDLWLRLRKHRSGEYRNQHDKREESQRNNISA